MALWLMALGASAQTSTDNHDVGLTIPEIALLDIEPDYTTITLSLDPPTEAGLPLTVATAGTNSSKWLNYSSSLAPGSTARTVTAQVTSGTLPAGVNLRVQAGTYAGNGAGTLGTPVGLVTLGATAKTIISGIGGCYTGDGSSKGHRLTYSVAIGTYSALNFSQGTNLQITYTISD